MSSVTLVNFRLLKGRMNRSSKASELVGLRGQTDGLLLYEE